MIEPQVNAPITVSFGAASDTGLKRRHNEDSYLAQAPLFLVADGMGGYEAGEVASAAVVDTFSTLVGKSSLDVDDMRRSYLEARGRVVGLPKGGGAGAGTTLSGVAIASSGGVGYWLIINVGDSRTYRFARGVLEQISVDHSVVQELVDDGTLTAATAAGDGRRNVVTRAIGAGSHSEADFWLIPAALGDRMLVCSDGLSGELTNDKITAILASESDPQQAATRLVHEAIIHGGRDNITVLVVDAINVTVAANGADGAETDTVPREPTVDEGAA